jgi:flagellar protein FlaJ
MMVTLFGIVPLLILIVGYFSPSFSVVSLLAFAGLAVPTSTVLLVFLAGRLQPVGEEPLAGNGKRAFLLSVPGLGVGFLGGQAWLGMASGVILFFVLYGYSVREQRRTMAEIDQALPAFMKDMLEFKRQEYDLTKSILKIAAYNRYTPSFDRLITRVAAELKAGTPLDEMAADARTRLGRIIFFILGQMARSGGGTVETFYQLTAYTTKVDEMKRRTRNEMRPYLLLSYVTPVLLAFGVTFISGVLTSFGSSVNEKLVAAHLTLPSGIFHPELFQISSALIVVAAAAMGLVGAKMTDFTVRNTLRASTNVLIAVAATALLSGLNIAGLFHLY